MFCSQCGNNISEGSTFCTNCGTKVGMEVKEAMTDQIDQAHETLKEEVEAVKATVEEDIMEDKRVASINTEMPEMPHVPEMPEVEMKVEQPLVEEKVVSGAYIAADMNQEESPEAPKVGSASNELKHSRAAEAPASYDLREEPMTLWAWIGTWLLMLIPIAQLILPFVWAFSSSTNRSKKTFFQAYLIISLILIVLGVVFGSALFMFFSNISEDMFY